MNSGIINNWSGPVFGQSIRGGRAGLEFVRVLISVFLVYTVILPANADGYQPTSDQYNVEGALGGFILDQLSIPPRMKFDWSSEIFILQETPGPRGGTYFKIDTGQNIVAETGTGGVILFTKIYPNGAPAAWVRSTGRLKRPFLSVSDAYAQIYRIEEKLNERLRQDVRYMIDWDRMSNDVQFRINATDVAQISGSAVLDLCDDADNLQQLRKRVREIQVVEAAKPGIEVIDQRIVVRFDGNGGVLGRYSSQRTALLIKQDL